MYDSDGPAVLFDGINNYYLHWVNCSKCRHLWILNLLFQIAMVCLIYIYLMFTHFQINLTSSPLNLIVMFLQFVVQEVNLIVFHILKEYSIIGQIPIKMLYTIFAILNLDFFTWSYLQCKDKNSTVWLYYCWGFCNFSNFYLPWFALNCMIEITDYSATSIIRTPLSTGLIITYRTSEIVRITEVPTFLTRFMISSL